MYQNQTYFIKIITPTQSYVRKSIPRNQHKRSPVLFQVGLQMYLKRRQALQDTPVELSDPRSLLYWSELLLNVTNETFVVVYLRHLHTAW